MYRKRYLIGVYAPLEEGETLLALLTSIREFAEFMDITYDNAVVILHNLFNHHTSKIRFGGRLCSVEFIPEAE